MATTVHVNTVPTTGGFKLDSLCVSIHFTGSAQSLAIPEHIIKWTTNTVTSTIYEPSEFFHSKLPIILTHCFTGLFFPFFPLPPTFDPLDRLSWQALVHQIQLHLIQLKYNLTWEEHITECLIVREFFWMAFIAAFPSFPYGDWPDWNPRITMDGDFISYWISDTDAGSVKPESVGMIWEFVWKELKALTIHVLPPDIVSEFFSVT
ncbi:hypothetical protein PAXRUDRAFT_152870 [Paxillus rubicundulus Ve08.2h10]|uniref:Uncharacterized protein n=1 Tax=Paxillus rubicundulus Ve08.2h10 TaxID=930991 RepID=A0A0D0DPI1_9AGAM|nr:hypothetical protein PAXRUDRAFT_163263 [Paxillus rubicundulus Ve08.2h10]KIK84659.1 hypothetical protein PAXRUDRAFT_152870 [Paxillus rubicundulus Ve08.2h10]